MMFLTGMMVSFYPSPVSPKGEKLKPSSNEALIWKTITIINQPAPFPFGTPQGCFAKGGGIGACEGAGLYHVEVLKTRV